MKPSDLLGLWHVGVRPMSLLAVDTETSGLFADDGARISTVSVAWLDPNEEWRMPGLTWKREEFAPDEFANIVSVAWPFDQGKEGKPEDDGQQMLFPEADNLSRTEYAALLDWITKIGGGIDGQPRLVFHNAKFDLEKFRVGVRLWPGRGVDLQDLVEWDTQNVCDYIYPLEKTSLKPTAMRLFDVELGDEAAKVKKYLKAAKLPTGRWDLMPWSVIGQYADLDARLTLMLRLRQQWEIDSHDPQERAEMMQKIDRRLAVTMVLYRMEWRGLPYHEILSRDQADLCRERAAELAKDLPFDPTGPKAKHYFFGEGTTDRGVECLNMVPYSVSEKTGEPSMTAEILGRMVEDRIPFADKWNDYTKVDNAASMWYEGYADKMGQDGRLRCAFRQNGTVSTRFSVERVNLQAIPQDYRLTGYAVMEGILTPRQLIAKAVEAMPGWKIYELDLAQAELRVGAMFAQCTSMLEMISAGTDLHTYTTSALFPDMKPGVARWGEYRQVGKRANFSLLFGSGWLTFQRMVSKETGIRLPDHVAQQIVVDWNRLFPEFKGAIDKHSLKVAGRQVRRGYGWIDLINGERRWFDKYEETHKAFNQRVQGNLAQFGIDWMLRTDGYLRRLGYGEENGAGLVLTIHDSQVLLLPDNEDGQALADDCAGFGRTLWKDWFPGVPGDVDFHAW